MTPPRTSLIRFEDIQWDRFWAKVDTSNECWNWTGALVNREYGCFYVGGIATLSHCIGYASKYGLPPWYMDVLHKHGGNKRCVHPDHLYLGTDVENAADRERDNPYYHYGVAAGEKNAMAVLSEEQALEILRRKAAGEKQYVLATEFGVSTATISFLVNGKTWGHLTAGLRLNL